MKKFYSDYNQIKVRQIKAILDDAGIPNFLKNEYIQGASGEIPPHEALPEIWLTDPDVHTAKANKLVAQMLDDLAQFDNTDWVCNQCSQTNEAPFLICWQCQHGREAG